MGVHMFPLLNPSPTSFPIPLGHPSAPAPSFLYPASNLYWQFVSYIIHFFFFTFLFYFIFKLYIIVLVLPNIKMNPPQVYMCSPSWTLLPPPSPYHPSGLSQCFIHDISYMIYVSMPVSQIFPPSPSPTESISLFYTSVSLLLSRTQSYCCNLSKFHIYALEYCIGVFLSGLLHSVE